MKEWLKKFIPSWLFSFYHWVWALLGALVYRFPGRDLKIIGITGTNGKTTVVHLLSEILQRAGFKVASISSLRFQIDEREWLNDLKMTMPGRLKIQQFLASAEKAGCSHVILEVTSEGIKQHRHLFIPFSGAVLTNVTKEHLEAHGGFENYKRAKMRLFEAVANYQKPDNFSVVNLDDPTAPGFLNFNADKKIGYSLQGPATKSQKLDSRHLAPGARLLAAEKIKQTKEGTNFVLNNEVFKTSLLGAFNVANALAAIGAAYALGLTNAPIRTALERFSGAAGRLEFITHKPFRVVVDYAHTPDALSKVYETLLGYSQKGKGIRREGGLICVLGATGGGRDKWKRPELGKLAAQFCERVIVTNEDPYDEDPAAIIEAAAQGVRGAGKTPEIILDRKEAVARAVNLARANDTVIITGKGAEPWMVMAGGKKIPWDDRLIAKQALAGVKGVKPRHENG